MRQPFLSLPIAEGIPEQRARFLFRVRNEKARADDEQLAATQSHGVLSQKRYMALTRNKVVAALAGTDNFNHVDPDDFVISLRTFEGGIERATEAGCISPAYTVIAPSKEVEPAFFQHLLKSQVFISHLQTTVTGIRDGKSVKFENFANMVLPTPDLATQRQIANFLDRETARIDLLIEKKQRLVALLGAKKETLRDTAVCKGLSDAADMKSSGVNWFGEVPANWTVCRFNRLIASKVDYRGRTPEKVDDGVFLVTARNIRDGKIDYQRSEEYTTAEDWEKLSARGKPRIGDVLFTTEAPLGQIAQVDRTDVAFAQRIIKFRADDVLASNDFLAEFMMTASFQRSLQLYSSGSTAAGIKSERLAHLSGLVPSKDEQSQIVKFVRQEIDQLNALEVPIKSSIDRLREYRSALITAAVTGQIDVQAYARSGTTDRRLDAIQEEMAP